MAPLEEGVESGDTGALRAVYDEGLLAPDSTFTPIQDIPGASEKTYVGLDGVRKFMRAWTQNWAEWRIGVDEVIDPGDDRVVAVGCQSAVGKGSGVPVSLRFGMVFTLKNG